MPHNRAGVMCDSAEAGPRSDIDFFDAVLAADVFPYLGDLDRVFRLTRLWLRRSIGLFILSFEAGEAREVGKSGYRLAPSGRYQHSREHLETLAAHHEFDVQRVRPVVLRYDRGTPVYGFIMVLCTG